MKKELKREDFKVQCKRCKRRWLSEWWLSNKGLCVVCLTSDYRKGGK